MTRDIRLGATTGEDIARQHDEGAREIADTARSMPEGVDAGLGSVHVGRIVAGVAETAAGLADIGSATAVVVRDTDGEFGETEAEVARVMRDMGDDLESDGSR